MAFTLVGQDYYPSAGYTSLDPVKQYVTAPVGSCGGARTALANWGTRISSVHVR